MRYRQLDANGDYTISLPFLVNSPAAVAQAILTRLRLWTGEWFLDRTEGTPWDQQVLGPRANSNPDAAIKQRILGTAGVTGITSYSSSYVGSTRAFSVTATVATLYGAATVTEVFNS